MDKFSNGISQTDSVSVQGYRGLSEVNDWFTTTTFESPDVPDDFLEDRFYVTFSSEAHNLRSLETDLLFNLRKRVDKFTTPKLEYYQRKYQNASILLTEREQMVERIDKNLSTTDQSYVKSKAENEELEKEMTHVAAQLEEFSAEDSYKIIEMAKKAKFVDEEWERRRKTLTDELAEVHNESKAYSTGSTASGGLTKQLLQQEDNLRKIRYKQEEIIRTLDADLKLSDENSLTAIQHVTKEQSQHRTHMLSHERKQTNLAHKKAASGADRLVTKLRRDIDTALKPALKIVQKGDIEKSSAAVQTFIAAYKLATHENLRPLVNDLGDVAARFYTALDSDFDRQLAQLKSRHDNQIAQLQAAHERKTARLVERNIEIRAAVEQLSAIESHLADIQAEADNFQTVNNDLATQLAAKTREHTDKAEANNAVMKMCDVFVHSAGVVITKYGKLLDQMLDRGRDFVVPSLPRRPKTSFASRRQGFIPPRPPAESPSDSDVEEITDDEEIIDEKMPSVIERSSPDNDQEEQPQINDHALIREDMIALPLDDLEADVSQIKIPSSSSHRSSARSSKPSSTKSSRPTSSKSSRPSSTKSSRSSSTRSSRNNSKPHSTQSSAAHSRRSSVRSTTAPLITDDPPATDFSAIHQRLESMQKPVDPPISITLKPVPEKAVSVITPKIRVTRSEPQTEVPKFIAPSLLGDQISTSQSAATIPKPVRTAIPPSNPPQRVRIPSTVVNETASAHALRTAVIAEDDRPQTARRQSRAVQSFETVGNFTAEPVRRTRSVRKVVRQPEPPRVAKDATTPHPPELSSGKQTVWKSKFVQRMIRTERQRSYRAESDYIPPYIVLDPAVASERAVMKKKPTKAKKKKKVKVTRVRQQVDEAGDGTNFAEMIDATHRLQSRRQGRVMAIHTLPS